MDTTRSLSRILQSLEQKPRRTERHSFLCKAVKRRSARCIGSVFAFLLGLTGASASDTTTSAKHAGIDVDVPLRFEYALLERLLVTQLFTGAGDTLEVLNDPAGCSEAVLREPVLSSTDGLLEMQAMLSGRLGVGGAGSCSIVFNWQGRVGISGVPEIRDGGTALGFAPSRVRLLDPSGTPVRSNALASLADAGARTAFRRFQIDLKPQIQSVGDLLPEVLPRHSRQQLEALLRTVRITGLSPAAEAVEANISFRVDEIPPRAPSEDALSEEELARWEERWQLMDALLVMAVKHYAAASGAPRCPPRRPDRESLPAP